MKLSINVTGTITDYIYKNGVLVKKIEGHNLILDSFKTMFRDFLNLNDLDSPDFQKSTAGFYFLIGSGAESWDSNMPTPEKTQKYLEHPIWAVKASSYIMNKDTGNDFVRYTADFPAGSFNGNWREFGLAYALAADVMPFPVNSNFINSTYYLLDKYHHPLIEKTNDIRVKRTLDFKFTIR